MILSKHVTPYQYAYDKVLLFSWKTCKQDGILLFLLKLLFDFFSTWQIYWKFTNHRIAGEGRDQYHFNNKVSTAANQKEIKFSFEKGKHGKSSFLDVEVSWEGNKFVTTAYHKFKYYYLWIWHDIYFGFQVFFNLF